MVAHGRLSYLALGDSYTIGEGVAADGSWPAQLARALRAQGTALDDPRIIAKTGWSTDEKLAMLRYYETVSTTSTADAPSRTTRVSSPPCWLAWSAMPVAVPTACWCCRSRTGG